jgi:hypothetical protein
MQLSRPGPVCTGFSLLASLERASTPGVRIPDGTTLGWGSPKKAVQHATGQAKFWLEPAVELAQDHGLGHRQISVAFRLLKENEDEVRAAWEDHFYRRG